jgi:hypothetical protein
MIAQRDKDFILFTFSGLERHVLERTIKTLVENYKLPPGQIDQRAGAVWYSTRGCETARISAEETAEWLKQLHAVRIARVEFLEKCLEQLARRAPGPVKLGIPVQNAESLMTALNDHRLLVAAQNAISEREMTLRSLASFAKLPPGQQTALCEIEFLAYVIEELLRLLQNSD